MHDLKKAFYEAIAEGLKSKSLSKCSKWAENKRVMGFPFPGQWTFKYHPWLKDMHNSERRVNVGQKAAQVGFTETVLNIALFHIDVRRKDVLYVLPAKTPDAKDFSIGRFDAALEGSPSLSKIFSDVKNIGHKRAGKANLYIRGSRSKAGLKSVPAGVLILDEVEEMTQENIPLAMERVSGYPDHMIWMVSTPRSDNRGINSYFLSSTQNHFFFKCPHCCKLTELVFPDCLVITAQELEDPNVDKSHLICKECKSVLDHKTKSEWLADGQWVSKHPNRDDVGWYVNQLYSSAVKPATIAKAYLRAQLSKEDEQEFYNSKLGIPHIVEGSRLTDTDLNQCRGTHKRGNVINNGRIITMGIDVGTFLHYEIDEWILAPTHANVYDLNMLSTPIVVDHGKVRTFDELDMLMMKYYVRFAVIDAQPERRKAYEFAQKFWGIVRLCFYARGIVGKQIHLSNPSENEPSISVDRTSWLDLSLGRFHGTKKRIILPLDFDNEYREHLKAPIRLYERDKDGNPIGRYDSGSDPDHYAHARNYSEIALNLAISLAQSQDIRKQA